MRDTNKISLIPCIAILVGGMIGSAIFSLSGLTIAQAGPACIISWGLAALIMLIYGLLMAEMSIYYPKSGGSYVFPSKAIGGKSGKILGWITCWGFLLTNIAAISFSAIYVGQYLNVGFNLGPEFQIPLAAVSVILVFILNIVKLKSASKINNILVIGLVLILAIYVFVSMTNNNYDFNKLIPFFDQGASGKFGFLSMTSTALAAYSAVIAIAFIASAVKNPKRNIPLATGISVIIVFIVYGAVLLATLGLTTAGFLSQNPDMEFVPLFASCFIYFPWLSKIISIAAVIALLTTMYTIMNMNIWALNAAAEDKVLPKVLLRKNKNDVPIVCAIVISIICIVISFFPELTNEIISFGVIFNVITIFICVVSVFYARKNNKSNHGFKVPGGLFTPIILLIALIVFNIYSIITGGIGMYIFTFVFLIIGLIIYFTSRSNKD